VVTHRDKVRDLDQRQSDNQRRLTEARNACQRDQAEVARRVKDEGVVAPELLAEAREYRQAIWALVKARFIDDIEIPTDLIQVHAKAMDDLPGAFSGSVAQADSIADRRFDQAKAAGELTSIARNIAEYEAQISELERTQVELAAESAALNEAWLALWSDVPVEPLAPDLMLGWLESQEGIATLMGRRRMAERQLEEARKEQQEAIKLVQASLATLGTDADAIKADNLRLLIERAEAYRRDQEGKSESISATREAVRKAKAEVGRRQREMEQAEAALASWQAEWDESVTALDLPRGSAPDVVDARIRIVDEMREHATSARELRDKRIAAIERDVAVFENAVAEIVSELAPNLVDVEAEEAVLALDARREEAMKLRQRHAELTKAVTQRQRKLEELEVSRTSCWASVQPLYETAGTGDFEGLRAAIEASDRARSLNIKLSAVMHTLEQQGDGLSVEALEKECRGVDIDAVQARQQAAEAELSELAGNLEAAVETRAEARRAFDAIGGDDDAARAAADREEARAAMRDAAEQYVRVRSSSTLLRWAIDRYRKEKQGPLLKRAGELFRILTGDSFERLEVGFDEKEDVRLMGVRPNGDVVPVPGLSSGTEDQLFLALRIAAVEDYLSRAVALPFVADDLFINFDKSRAVAGFEVLGQLSEYTQVLFYTHDEHLVDVARKAIGEGVHVVQLADAA